MTVGDFRKLKGKRVRGWTKRDAGRYEQSYLDRHPSFVGEVGDITRRNVLIGGDYQYIPDISSVQEIA